MTQRIFDVENEKDYTDLWDIVPENIVKIRKGYKSEDGYYYNFYDTKYIEGFYETAFLIIDWHDKTEITRPMPEATEADAGKLCMFWNNDGTRAYGVLSDLITSGINGIKYGCCYGKRWTHARRLTKQEIEELI